MSVDTDLAGAGLAANEILDGLLNDLDALLKAGKFTLGRAHVKQAKAMNAVQAKAFEAIQRGN